MMDATITVDARPRDRLRRYDRAGMTFDEIIRRLMDSVDRERFIRDLHDQADMEKDWVEMDEFDWAA